MKNAYRQFRGLWDNAAKGWRGREDWMLSRRDKLSYGLSPSRSSEYGDGTELSGIVLLNFLSVVTEWHPDMPPQYSYIVNKSV